MATFSVTSTHEIGLTCRNVMTDENRVLRPWTAWLSPTSVKGALQAAGPSQPSAIGHNRHYRTLVPGTGKGSPRSGRIGSQARCLQLSRIRSEAASEIGRSADP